MSIGSPRLHIICGLCGCNNMLSFEVKSDVGDEDENITYTYVNIICGNCGTLTELNEIIKRKEK